MPQPLRFSFVRLKTALKGLDKSVQKLGLFDPNAFGQRPRHINEQIIRAACSVAYLGDNTALCRVLGRYKSYVDTTDIALSSHLMLDGYWEMWVTEALYALVRPGMVVADVGANVGYFSLLMAELVGPTGRVHAFEPNPRLAGLVEKSLMVNGFAGWASIHQTALGNEDGQSVTLVVPPTMPMNAYILAPDAEVPPGGVDVPVSRLDSRADWREIELAKIDVEGAEELIWSGLQGLLDGERLRTVVLEFNAHRYSDPVAFLERICANGFALHHLTYDKGVVPTDRAFILANSGPQDIMLVLTR